MRFFRGHAKVNITFLAVFFGRFIIEEIDHDMQNLKRFLLQLMIDTT